MVDRSFRFSRSFGVLAVTGLLFSGAALRAQVTGSTTTGVDPNTGKPTTSVTMTGTLPGKKKKEKVDRADRVQQTKDTKKEVKKQDKFNPLLEKDATLPDKQLFDKALAQEKSGHYDVARLDLQTLLNTYPDSQYQMRAKLAVADSWYREGGSAALAQAEQEYKDFITFFPNAPEAAEAQMRVGDIYFKQMDVPDRDYTKATSAEAEYRTMLKQYPDAPPEILTSAKQKLREVQEVLASRETNIATYYSAHGNNAASIARFETIAETYPQYSRMDETLIGIGDAYAAQSKLVAERPVCATGITVPCLPEGAKAQLQQEYDGMAAAAYRKVVLDHSAAPHVEDAKERLAAMNLPIPEPTEEQRKASEELEGSRAQYNLRKRLELLFLHTPDTVLAAQSGEPPLEDPAAVTAPGVVHDLEADFTAALSNKPAPIQPMPGITTAAPVTSDANGTPANDAPAASAPAAAAPLALSDVPAAGAAPATTGATEMTPATTGGTAGTGVGVEILSPTDKPAATGAPDPNFGFKTVRPANSDQAPAVEKPADAPDQVNEVNGKPQPAAETAKPGKKPKDAGDYDKGDESSSKHKPKKGVDKLNPF